AKGLTGAHFPMGAVLISERVAEPFIEGKTMYMHGITFGGHPVGAAIARKTLEIYERDCPPTWRPGIPRADHLRARTRPRTGRRTTRPDRCGARARYPAARAAWPPSAAAPGLRCPRSRRRRSARATGQPVPASEIGRAH